MKRFAALYSALDATTSTNDKLDALITYFRGAEPEDAAWASYFLAGGKPRQSVATRVLIECARDRLKGGSPPRQQGWRRSDDPFRTTPVRRGDHQHRRRLANASGKDSHAPVHKAAP